MKVNAPEKIYLTKNLLGELFDGWDALPSNNSINIEYIRKDAFIKRAANYLDYRLFDVVKVNSDESIIPSEIVKGEFIEDFKNYMKGE